MESKDEVGSLKDKHASSGEMSEADTGAGDSLEDVARGEQEYVRERVREELKREPTDDEVADWQREHTEGY
ncbi:MAG: hypothetical protein LC754_11535 [Acidobacteria bacterium]|nr:hypothetical protein [Acidobacteriota bacterium]